MLEDRMKKLRATGDLPPDKMVNGKPGFRKQEEWFLNIEGVLSEIIELGGRNEDLGYHAFSEQTFNFVLSLFPPDIAVTLTEVKGTRQEQLVMVKSKLANLRLRSQRLGRIYGDKPPPGVSQAGNIDSRKPDVVTKQPQSAQPGSVFKTPENNSNCRI